MEPWQSWAIVAVVGAGAAYYYSQAGNKSRHGGGRANIQSLDQRRISKISSDSRGQRKKEKDRITGDQSTKDGEEVTSTATNAGGKDSAKRKRSMMQQRVSLGQSMGGNLDTDERRSGLEDEEETEEAMDNAEFAKHLSGIMTGTSLKASPAATKNKKAKRLNKRNQALQANGNESVSTPNGISYPRDNSTASSTTGADADDDLSLKNSPDLGAIGARETFTPSATNVSDMLEPPAKGPSILRLTEPANLRPLKQNRPQKIVQEPESKKQRQHRQKNEERKALREQAEQERRVLLDKQRRTVREAEGRPAKNGLSSGPQSSSNAWSKPVNPSSNGVISASKSDSSITMDNSSLLDTFDQESGTIASSHPGLLTSNGAPKTQVEFDDLPSEEDQMRMLSEMDSDNSWNKVEKGGRSKKKAPADTAAFDAGDFTIAGKAEVFTKDRAIRDGGNDQPQESLAEEKTCVQTAAPNTNLEVLSGAKSQNFVMHSKATRKTIDHSVWNRSNIHEHPDYDPSFPYALTGHPMDSDWEAHGWPSDEE